MSLPPSSATSITVVGLGPGNPGARTVAAQQALDRARRIILRTAIHPGIEDLLDDPRVSSCDDLYERLITFEELYPAIVDRLIESAQSNDIVYAVPGHPTFGERTVTLLRDRAAAVGISFVVLPAVSALDEIAIQLGTDPLADEVQILDATTCQDTLDNEPFAAGRLAVDPYRPLLVGQVYNSDLATAVKLALGHFYPDDHSVTVVSAAGVYDSARTSVIPLHDLDRDPVDHLTSVWVPPLAPLTAYRFERSLARTIARLRAPGGCPWDRKQTHASLRDAILDEAYEAADAIDGGDIANLSEELGDLLLLVALHSQIATEASDFTLEDVYEHLNRKLIRRHPHVFGDVEANTPADVVKTWNQIKAEERGATPQPSIYEKLPKSMPALTRLAKLLSEDPAALDPREVGSETPADALLSEAIYMIRSGLDPEHELAAALDRHYLGTDQT